MIHATELRIGNLLNQMLTSGKWEALPFEVQDFERLEMHPEYFNPIPLTEEWLLKFGFEKKHASRFGGINNVFQCNIDDLHSIIIDEHFCFLYESGRTKIKYVHQLQNLYFALTGQELEIKEKVW